MWLHELLEDADEHDFVLGEFYPSFYPSFNGLYNDNRGGYLKLRE